MAQEKEPFISSEERPVVGLHPDAPISQLRVRDLQTLLQGVTFFKLGSQEKQSEFKGPNGKEASDEKGYKDSISKNEKSENATEKYWKDAAKDEKSEADAFSRTKLNKENETHSSGQETVSPAAIDQLIRSISGLSQQVTNLTQEVEKLKQRSNEGQGI